MSPPRARSVDRRSLSRGLALACGLAACLTLGGVARAQNPRAWAGGETLPSSPATAAPVRVARVDSPPATSPVDQSQTPPDAGSVAAELAPSAGGAPASGEAAAELIPTGNLLSVVSEGGVLMLPLLGCSFVLAAFGIERLVALRAGHVLPRVFVDRFLEQLEAGEHDRASAVEACEANGSPAAVVVGAAVRRWGRPAVEIEQGVIDAGEREIGRLGRYRRLFHAIASTAPMLGLLGTVFGLIRSFNDVASAGAMGRPDLLAKGFGEALITTAMGLLVAIPAMVIHSWLTSRVEYLAMRLDEVAQRVIHEISLEGPTGSGQASARPKKQAA